jgi:hypothetical protein
LNKVFGSLPVQGAAEQQRALGGCFAVIDIDIERQVACGTVDEVPFGPDATVACSRRFSGYTCLVSRDRGLDTDVDPGPAVSRPYDAQHDMLYRRRRPTGPHGQAGIPPAPLAPADRTGMPDGYAKIRQGGVDPTVDAGKPHRAGGAIAPYARRTRNGDRRRCCPRRRRTTAESQRIACGIANPARLLFQSRQRQSLRKLGFPPSGSIGTARRCQRDLVLRHQNAGSEERDRVAAGRRGLDMPQAPSGAGRLRVIQLRAERAWRVRTIASCKARR